jgi:Type IIA topoisomerase (DNA gyrase/topo II, topoisomerase IV), A subunit
MKDKGVLIHTLCKLNKENVILYTSFEVLFEAQLLFTTKLGYIKQVSGVEFETNRSQIAATKLEEQDEVVSICLLSATDVMAGWAGSQKVIILTEKGLSLGFSLADVSELKKTSRGVKAITLEKNDTVCFAIALNQNTETFLYKEKELSVKKVRNRKRGDKGQKATL